MVKDENELDTYVNKHWAIPEYTEGCKGIIQMKFKTWIFQ